MSLRHDVAKYLVRVACNLAPGPVPTALVPLLLRDLYESPSGGRPSARFAALSREVDATRAQSINARFVQLDALEAAARGGDAQALRTAADLALDISRAIDAATERA